MARHLLALAFGPVQGFIVSARRTRDLWYGSHLLSEVSRGAALHIDKSGGELIFPALDRKRLGAKDTPVANKVVAVVETPDITAFAHEVKEAASRRYRELASKCLIRLDRGCDHAINMPLWNEQVQDTIEAYAAWASYPNGADYKVLNDRVNSLLAARKATRIFKQISFDAKRAGYSGVKKSSLDGARESVFNGNPSLKLLRARFGVDDGEELDAVGLVKRVMGKGMPFPSVTRVALAPWIDAQSESFRREISSCYDVLVNRDVGTRMGAESQTQGPQGYEKLPYDCEYLLKSRLDKAISKYQKQENEWRMAIGDSEYIEIVKVLNELRSLLYSPNSKGEGGDKLPPPSEEGLYVALLLADGDQMGALIDAAETRDHHQSISNALAEFAHAVPELLSKHHKGVSVYAGGDDVLAFLPVSRALACARELAEEFESRLRRPYETVRNALEAKGKSSEAKALLAPSLSVGLAIGHVLEPLGNLRVQAHRAEQLAKKGHTKTSLRNALGVIIQPRGGGAIEVCGRWDEAGLPAGNGRRTRTDPGFDRRLSLWATAIDDGKLAGSAGYRLRALSQELDGTALVDEVMRLVAHGKQSDKALLEQIKVLLGRSGKGDGAVLSVAADTSAEQLEQEWIAARWLASHRGHLPFTAKS